MSLQQVKHNIVLSVINNQYCAVEAVDKIAQHPTVTNNDKPMGVHL